MSKQISEYFKATPKSQNSEKNFQTEENYKQNNLNLNKTSSKIRNCSVNIKNIKSQLPRNFKLFDEVSINELQNSKSNSAQKGQTICKFCTKKLSNSKNLDRHIKDVHSDILNLLSCLICNMKFFKQSSLIAHLKIKHPDGCKEQFECDFDGKTFKTKKKLYLHMQIHLPLVECKICHKMLKLRSMEPHLTGFHAIDKKFQCKICSKMFKTQQILGKHEMIHNKNFQCEICKKMLPSKVRLNEHIRNYHNSLENYKCEICGKEFKIKSCLESHKKVHDRNRPKPYKCQRCDFATDGKQSINYHQKFHERQDEKLAAMKNSIKCEKCPAFLPNKDSLRSHMHYVHPKVLYQCDLCALFLKTRYGLTKHIKLHEQKNVKYS